MRWIAFCCMALSLWSSLCEACEEDLKVREYLPLDGAVDVPINSRLVVAFIGMGTLEDFDIKVYNGASRSYIGVDKEGWCYTHEGPHELHCWARLTPRQALESWTTYEIQVQRVYEDTGEEEEEPEIGAFITSDQEVSTGVSALGLTVTDAWEMDPSELDSCDWDEVSRWWLEVDPVSYDTTRLELFHIYELDEAGEVTTTDPIHTIFSPPNASPQEVKQYLDGDEEHSQCFGIQREGATGALGEMTTDCYDEVKDTSDSGKPREPDSGEEPEDSGSSDGAETDSDGGSGGSAEPVYPVSKCGCAAPGISARLGLLLAWLGLVTSLRRRA